MQRLWADKIDWDKSVSLKFYMEWQKWREQLILNNWKISQQTLVSIAVRIQLHNFADDSKKAYGACIYLRSKTVPTNPDL